MREHVLKGDFAGSDDLLWAAEQGSLSGTGSIRVTRSGQIGPLIEILMRRQSLPEQFVNLTFDAHFTDYIEAALSYGRVVGTEKNSTYGVFPISRVISDADKALWELWLLRAEQAAFAGGLPRSLAAALVGALVELQDNILEHSTRPESGLVAYGFTGNAFEVVVADSGIGVLSSLRANAEYAAVSDAGHALKIAVQDGQSRYGSNKDRGFGMGQMFRALVNHDGDLRFRSDDYSLTVRGHSPSLSGTVELSQKARLPGLTISVRCATSNSSAL